MAMPSSSVPILIRVLPSVGRKNRDARYRYFILLLTFACYTSYHLSRKPISVVKSVLHRNCSDVHHKHSINETNEYWCDWKPFDTGDASSLLGYLDLAYLISYAVAMFFSGHIADRYNLRHFLSFGMIGSGLFTIAFGLGYFYHIHELWFYILIQTIGGCFQATGWPSVVACVGNWFGKGKRGLIMGIWNAHTSVGNILGSVIAGAFVEIAWGWSFVVPGVIIGTLGILVFLFMVPHPKDVDCTLPDHSDNTRVILSRSIDTEADTVEEEEIRRGETTYTSPSKQDPSDAMVPHVHIWYLFIMTLSLCVALLPNKDHRSSGEKPISIFKAILIPGVLEFSFCLFFAKLVSYTFLYWLPKYISEKTSLSADESAYTSTMFDIGGVIGGILAGHISDRFRLRGVTCVVFLMFAAPMLFVYQQFGSDVPYYANCLLLAACGIGVNGPYGLITTAVSADLGTHKSVRHSSKALGIVTAIIDGTGSVGAALGPMLTGIISKSSWENVFYMLIGSIIMAILLLSRVVVKEIRKKLSGYEDDITIIVPKNTVQEDEP